MGILRTDKISGLETPTAVTGSVVFDGDGDTLEISDSNGLLSLPDSFTIELFVNFSTVTSAVTFVCKTEDDGQFAWFLQYISSSGGIRFYPANAGSTGTPIIFSWTPSAGTWYHLALTRDESNDVRMFVDGIQIGSTGSNSDNLSSTGRITIGDNIDVSGTQELNGYISNLRILKGTALYTSDFTVPTHELEVIGDTVLLCCNNPDSAGADGTGKTITVNGDAAASTVSPGLIRDFTFGTEFKGVTTFDTQGYFVPPSGTTTERFVEVANNAVSASSARGINGGGYIAPNNTNTMQYITIATTGNAADFGDLSSIRNAPGAVASSTRGVWMGGVGPSPGNTSLDVIDYVTIASTGNAADFGDLINNHRADSAAGDSTRGLRLGQQQTPAVGNTIEYITIASTGDAKDFGDLVQGRSQSGAFASPTRAVQFGGYGGPSVGNVNTIDYVTIQTMGNSIDFGDLKDGIRTGARGCSNATRGVFGGGYNPTPYASDLDYVTIASTGNSQDFGNLSMGNRYGSSCSSLTRGIFFIGESTSPTPGNRQNIDYVTIAALANANDFGDLISSYSGYTAAACSNGHGGLG